MNITRRTFGLGIAATGTLLACPAIAQQKTIVVKFSHVAAPDTPKGKGALKFKELAEKYTESKVSVEVYPNSQLYKDKEEMDALQLGAVQILAPSTSKFSPLGAKEFEALDLPFLFKDGDDFQAAMKGDVGKFLMAKLDPLGIKGLGFWENGFHMLTGNRPMVKPGDMKGMKVRISGSKVADHYFRLVGAIPQIIAFSEVYQAMQTGVVDGGENTPSNIYTQKFYEVQSDMTSMNHAHLSYAVITNASFWNGLPDDIRAQLDKAMSEATDYANSIAGQENADSLAKIVASGKTNVRTLTADQIKPWKAALAPTYDWAVTRVGQPVIDLLKARA